MPRPTRQTASQNTSCDPVKKFLGILKGLLSRSPLSRRRHALHSSFQKISKQFRRVKARASSADGTGSCRSDERSLRGRPRQPPAVRALHPASFGARISRPPGPFGGFGGRIPPSRPNVAGKGGIFYESQPNSKIHQPPCPSSPFGPQAALRIGPPGRSVHGAGQVSGHQRHRQHSAEL